MLCCRGRRGAEDGRSKACICNAPKRQRTEGSRDTVSTAPALTISWGKASYYCIEVLSLDV